MCGINGLLNFDPARPADQQLVHRMREVARHRGPDDHGVYFDGPAGLGFNRLSIIDLSGGHQPLSNEDGTVWIVFNGEIYNFQPLREELIARGHRFRTRCDTETIVHAWEEYGERCVEHLRGMFGLAIWDSRQHVLFLARDRLGIKPLFYYADARRFAFASELKSLLEIPELPREVDPVALEQFLRHRYVLGPRTMLRHVRKLLPGHTLTVRDGKVEARHYWQLPLEAPRRIGLNEALEEFDSLIGETMRQHLIADVPLGSFLSGGLDSSAVVAFMARQGVEKIKTFSIGYDSPESELPYARRVARHYGTDHHELVLTPGEFQEQLPKILWHMDEPIADEAALPLYHVARLARQSVTVALSGEGSDEVFSGYPIYRIHLALEKLNRVPLAGAAGAALAAVAGESKLRKYARLLGRPLEERYGGVSTALSSGQVSALLRARADGVLSRQPLREGYALAAGLPALARMGLIDITTWLPDNLLVKADRMSMANSLELRVPFLDHKVVEFGFALPPELKMSGGVGKFLLKKYVEPMLPREIIYRPKKGFPVPTSSWFAGKLAGWVRETLTSAGGPCDSLFERGAVEEILSRHGRSDQSAQLYSLLVFSLWYRRVVSRQGD